MNIRLDYVYVQHRPLLSQKALPCAKSIETVKNIYDQSDYMSKNSSLNKTPLLVRVSLYILARRVARFFLVQKYQNVKKYTN
jgi:hypothetical protein